MERRNEEIRVGIVGLGSMGHWHTELVENAGGDVVAGADVVEDARRHYERKWGIDTYASHEDLYADERLDAVIVTTPNKFHEPAAVDAFEADVDLLLEKPLAHTLDSAERIAAAAEDSDAFGMVGFHNRFSNAATALQGYVEEGHLGDVTRVETNYLRRRGVPGRGSWFTSSEIAGGGALVDIGVHIIDLTLHVLGYPEVTQVSGVARSEFGSRDDYAYLEMWGDDAGTGAFDVEDSAMAMLQTADGQTVSLDVAWATNGEREETISLRGTEAGATLDKAAGDLTLYETRDVGTAHHVDSTVAVPERNCKEAQARCFLDAVATGESPGINTIDEALVVQRVIEGIYRSSDHDGRLVRLKSDDVAVEGPMTLD
ncbi:Gfo/Idh/MocA family protein [Halegenticoccus tardaugens]|uniref:Gfo/Idh/MocA family protein n=1 Tax=Halegenticoccus tardaugens TaxID=2071624 RepID=UPI00100B61D3|nr:Gfo/Idh/MocA family oxidoreductase [Halegenticoccus tardaugens]